MTWTGALTGREWATAVWVLIALTWMLTRRDLRPYLFQLVRIALSGAVFRNGLLMLAYITAVVFAASRLGLWEARLIGATLAWIVVSAIFGFFKVLEVPKDRHHLRTALKRALAVTVLVDAYVNLVVLPFWAEMLLVPAITFLAVLIGVAAAAPQLASEEYDTTRSCLNGVLQIFGIAVFVYSTAYVIHEISSPAGLSHLGKSLVLPLWLNLALIPFMSLLAARLVYETTFLMLSFAPNASPASLRRAKIALLLSVGLRPYVLGDFGHPWPYRLNAAPTLAEARRVASELRAERQGMS
jgi:hypothetical protein